MSRGQWENGRYVPGTTIGQGEVGLPKPAWPATRSSDRTRKGSTWLRRALIDAARGAVRTKQAGRTALAGHHRRLVTRRGRARAAVAVAHSILIIAYLVLMDGTVYCDLGGNYFNERDRQGVERRLVHRLEGLGYTVSLQPAA